MAEDLEAVDVGEFDVEEDEGRIEAFGHLEAFGAGACGLEVEGLVAESGLEETQHVDGVIDRQHERAGCFQVGCFDPHVVRGFLWLCGLVPCDGAAADINECVYGVLDGGWIGFRAALGDRCFEGSGDAAEIGVAVSAGRALELMGEGAEVAEALRVEVALEGRDAFSEFCDEKIEELDHVGVVGEVASQRAGVLSWGLHETSDSGRRSASGDPELMRSTKTRESTRCGDGLEWPIGKNSAGRL